ncbi:MAG: AMP-binding protein [Blastocatellia bacterium]|nr:AMP-binding protein [Blastocatellia bacterium]
MNYTNIYSLFRQRVEEHSNDYIFYTRKDNSWYGITWKDFASEVYNFGYALIKSGLTRKASVCILMGNVTQWPVADIGTIIAGGVGVGLYPTSSPEQCRYIIDHSDAEFVVVDTRQQLEKILQVRFDLPKLKLIVSLDEDAAREHQAVIGYQEFLKIGREHAELASPILLDRAESAQAEDIAIMVYTSGTTGLPKGACLSHRYIINSVESLLETIAVTNLDRSFSYLPYCHVAERISGMYNRLYAGASAYFVDNINKLWDYMLEVKPTVFGSLPRFYEKIYARIVADFEKAPLAEKELFYKVLEVGKKISRLKQNGESVAAELQQEYNSISPAIIEKVRGYFGGSLRIATSGGAPLPYEIAEFFDALKIPILQAYGLQKMYVLLSTDQITIDLVL